MATVRSNTRLKVGDIVRFDERCHGLYGIVVWICEIEPFISINVFNVDGIPTYLRVYHDFCRSNLATILEHEATVVKMPHCKLRSLSTWCSAIMPPHVRITIPEFMK